MDLKSHSAGLNWDEVLVSGSTRPRPTPLKDVLPTLNVRHFKLTSTSLSDISFLVSLGESLGLEINKDYAYHPLKSDSIPEFHDLGDYFSHEQNIINIQNYINNNQEFSQENIDLHSVWEENATNDDGEDIFAWDVFVHEDRKKVYVTKPQVWVEDDILMDVKPHQNAIRDFHSYLKCITSRLNIDI